MNLIFRLELWLVKAAPYRQRIGEKIAAGHEMLVDISRNRPTRPATSQGHSPTSDPD